MFGYLDSGKIGHSLFSDSPLPTPEPTLPPSPTQKLTSLDDHNLPLDPQLVPGKTASTSAGQLENAGKKYGSNKQWSHAKWKRDRAEQQKEREARVHAYDVWPTTRQKLHNPNSKAIDAKLDLMDGQPDDSNQLEEQKWSKGMADVEREMEEASKKCWFDSKDLNHCRGPFPALAAGVSFGGGQVIPGNLAHNQAYHRVL
ncbi:hypothetical protein L208DRAFT_1281632 [Tricholoma matsutake]|nr:hypothetical protein L208DRAFT_1281632 [Tricholoma matsutake 945]